MRRMLVWLVLAGIGLLLGVLTGCGGGNGSGGGGGQPFTVSFAIAPKTATVEVGHSIDFTASVTLNEAPVENPQISWSVDNTLATISSSGRLTAGNQGGTVTVTATYAYVEGATQKTLTDTAVVTISTDPVDDPSNPITGLVVEPAAPGDVQAGQTLTFTAYLVRQDGTRTAVTPTWSVVGNLGTISAQGVFLAQTAGTGQVKAVYTLNSSAWTATAAVRVVAGPPAELTINVSAGVDLQHLTICDRVAFTATVSDASGNTLPSAGVTWSVQGTIGSITQSGLFTAELLGTGAVVAQVTSAPEVADSVTVKVTSAFNGLVAFAKKDALTSNLAVLTGNRQVTGLTSGANIFTAPQWSPDGTTLAFGSQGSPSLDGICVMNAGGGVPQLLFKSKAVDLGWSPDGTKIAYSNGVASGEIGIINAQTGTFLKKLSVTALGAPRSPSWSPQGNKLAFSVPSSIAFTGAVYVVPVDGSASPERVFMGNALSVQWSAARNLLAIADDRKIYTVSPSGGQRETVVNEEDGTLTGGLAWAPDGSGIIYAVQTNGAAQLKLVVLSTKKTVLLTNVTGASVLEPTWK